MKTVPEVCSLIQKELSARRTKLNNILDQLHSLKSRKEVTEEMKVSLVKYATEINEHKAVMSTLENLLNQIGR